MKKITILVPAYNEALNLPKMIEALERLASGRVALPDGVPSADMTAYDWEFLIVNDGSRDDTLEVARRLRDKDPRVNIVNLSRNFGKENAMLAGFDYATGDAVIVMDADLQHPVETVPEMVYWWEQGYEDVYGLRRTRGKESRMRKQLSMAFYNLLQGTTRIEILRNVGDFRLLDRRAVNALKALRETQRYTKGLYCWVGYNKKEVLFDQGDREEGVSSFNFKSLLNLAIEGITCFTTAPLRISTIVGFVVSLIALIYMVYVIVKTLVCGEHVAGFPTLLCVILFLGGMQLIAIGIIGEYIGRIFNETKGRPVYLVESYNEKKL